VVKSLLSNLTPATTALFFVMGFVCNQYNLRATDMSIGSSSNEGKPHPES